MGDQSEISITQVLHVEQRVIEHVLEHRKQTATSSEALTGDFGEYRETEVRRDPEFVVLDHTADTGISATAPSLAELIETMAKGMFSLMAVVSPCPHHRSVAFSVSAASDEDLVYECLSELLYLSEVEDTIFCVFHVSAVAERAIEVEAGGAPSGEIELTGAPIKAVTYHEIEVTQSDDTWRGRIYFDV